MKLNAMQRRKVEDNVGLVHKVISDKVHGPFPVGIYTREDLFQTGCIGLCRAAATDRGGTFSTYAYRLIWNEICDLLIRSGRERKREISTGELPEGILSDPGNDHPEDRTELKIALERLQSRQHLPHQRRQKLQIRQQYRKRVLYRKERLL